MKGVVVELALGVGGLQEGLVAGECAVVGNEGRRLVAFVNVGMEECDVTHHVDEI